MRTIWTSLLFGLFPVMLLSQSLVQSIRFSGLKKTKEDYLLQVIDTEIGKPLDKKVLDVDLQRLINLGNISWANYQLDTIPEGIQLQFDIEEAFTLFPLVNFGGIRGNFWFQVGFTDLNWLGRGQQITAFYQNNDQRNNYSIFYRNQRWKGKAWGFSANLLRWASTEPLYFDDATVFYDYSNTSLSSNFIYNLSRRHFFELGASVFLEEYQKDNRHDGEITPGPEGLEQKKILGKFIHQINQLNYHYFYLSGWENVSNFQTVFNTADDTWFFIWLNDVKYFRRIGMRANLALRFRLGISSNDDTPFAPFVLDSQVNIRGAGNRIDRGTAALILNLEYRQTIIENRRFGVQLVGFSDLGTWRNPGGEFSDLKKSENFRHFIGSGFRFIYKKAFNAILRLDYGIDIYDKEQRGLVVGFGQYF